MPQWAPILSLSHDTGARAMAAVEGISQALIQQDYEPPSPEFRRTRNCEEPLLYGYLARARGDRDWFDRTAQHLNAAIDRGSSLTDCGLYGGVCGLGWTVEHISHLLGEITFPDQGEEIVEDGNPSEDEDLNADVDNLVIRELQRGNWHGPYDLISGLVGMGVYFLERLPSERAVLGLELVLYHLEKSAERLDHGISWRTGPELLPESQRETCPDGYYNLGAAHGVPGIIYLLGEAIAAGVEPTQAGRLLEGSMEWLIAQQRPPGSVSWFSSWVNGRESHDSRLAWCYGDLGILAILLQTARRSDREDWRKFSRGLLDHCLDWPLDRTGVGDSPLCHGAAGIAHIYNRIYQDEGDSKCLEASIAWFERALAMRQTKGGVGGFFAATRPEPGCTLLESNPAFLDGAIGIALALLAALTRTEPGWDRLLLLSGRNWRDGARISS
jgi:lantibiotic biosynthesis protein